MVDALPAEVLEQVVVRVNAVERGVGRMRFVEVPEQVVDEMRKWFGNGHGSLNEPGRRLAGVPAGAIRQWYNKAPTRWPARCSWSPRQSATSKTSRPGRCAVLREVALIAAEDTRRTAHLLARYGITTPTTSLHEHNEQGKSDVLLDSAGGGDSIALVSDAGTPTISDPGAHSHRPRARAGHPRRTDSRAQRGDRGALGFRVSGLKRLPFLGFPPTKVKRHEPRGLIDLTAVGDAVVIFYEAPHRILADLEGSPAQASAMSRL